MVYELLEYFHLYFLKVYYNTLNRYTVDGKRTRKMFQSSLRIMWRICGYIIGKPKAHIQSVIGPSQIIGYLIVVYPSPSVPKAPIFQLNRSDNNNWPVTNIFSSTHRLGIVATNCRTNNKINNNRISYILLLWLATTKTQYL